MHYAKNHSRIFKIFPRISNQNFSLLLSFSITHAFEGYNVPMESKIVAKNCSTVLDHVQLAVILNSPLFIHSALHKRRSSDFLGVLPS